MGHHRLRVPVATHHLHLAVGQSLVEGASDGRPSQVVRRKLADPAIIAPARTTMFQTIRVERLVELQRAVVGDGLEEMGVVPVAVQIAPARFIEFEILFDRRAARLSAKNPSTKIQLDSTNQNSSRIPN
jgi:hypothetical protein